MGRVTSSPWSRSPVIRSGRPGEVDVLVANAGAIFVAAVKATPAEALARLLEHYLCQADWDDGLEGERSVRHTLLVIEPGVSKTSSPSGSRTVARVTGPRGVG